MTIPTHGRVQIELLCLALFIPLMSSCGNGASGGTNAHSFNVITDVQNNSYLLSGYTGFVNNKSGAFSPGAVLIVGVAGGVELGGQQFDQGTIVIIDGDDNNKTFRVAKPTDNIRITSEVEVFGKIYPAGRFLIPDGGKLPVSE